MAFQLLVSQVELAIDHMIRCRSTNVSHYFVSIFLAPSAPLSARSRLHDAAPSRTTAPADREGHFASG